MYYRYPTLTNDRIERLFSTTNRVNNAIMLTRGHWSVIDIKFHIYIEPNDVHIIRLKVVHIKTYILFLILFVFFNLTTTADYLYLPIN